MPFKVMREDFYGDEPKELFDSELHDLEENKTPYKNEYGSRLYGLNAAKKFLSDYKASAPKGVLVYITETKTQATNNPN